MSSGGCTCLWLSTLLLACTWCAPACCEAAGPVVQVGPSSISGVGVRLGDKRVFKFLGIRYAEAPTGERRFQPPVPAQLPAHVNATRYGAQCPQHPLKSTGMSEDCLFLNIFAPDLPPGQHVPVLFWIHGGGFIIGSSHIYEGEWLAAEGEVVVVTVNYRLGVLGFLATGDNSSVGNYGLWDLRLALLWVRQHVRHFGGDHSRVTVAGMSAGGASASILSLSPLTRHLFSHVIQMSGAASSPWARVSSAEAVQAARVMGQRLHCGNGSTEALVRCLRERSVEHLVTSSALLFPHQVALSLVDYRWAPVKDGALVTDVDTAFPGPVLAGLVSNEGDTLLSWTVPRVSQYIPDVADLVSSRQFYRQQFLPTLLKQAFPSLVQQPYPSRADPDLTVYTQPPLSTAVRQLECAYLATSGHHGPGVSAAEVRQVFGDQAFVLGTLRYVQRFCRHQSIYLYFMDHQTERPGVEGIRHVDDVAYLFGFNTTIAHILGFPGHVTSLDLQLARDLRQLFFNFIKTGDPNTPALPDGWPSWAPYTCTNARYLHMSTTPQLLSQLKRAEMGLWLQDLSATLTSSHNVSHRQLCHPPPAAAHFPEPPLSLGNAVIVSLLGSLYFR